MKYDIRYLSNKSGLMQVPLNINGKASGVEVVVQQLINLMCAPEDNTRVFGGNLLSLLKGTNNTSEYVLSTVNYAVSRTAAYLNENGVPILEASVANIEQTEDRVTITLNLIIDYQNIEVTFQLPTEG